jgi:hypothetical protein
LKVYFDDCTGLTEISSNEKLIIKQEKERMLVHTASGNNMERIHIYALNGRKIFERKINSNIAELTIDLSKGIYIIECITKNEVLGGKIIVAE